MASLLAAAAAAHEAPRQERDERTLPPETPEAPPVLPALLRPLALRRDLAARFPTTAAGLEDAVERGRAAGRAQRGQALPRSPGVEWSARTDVSEQLRRQRQRRTLVAAGSPTAKLARAAGGVFGSTGEPMLSATAFDRNEVDLGRLPLCDAIRRVDSAVSLGCLPPRLRHRLLRQEALAADAQRPVTPLTALVDELREDGARGADVVGKYANARLRAGRKDEAAGEGEGEGEGEGSAAAGDGSYVRPGGGHASLQEQAAHGALLPRPPLLEANFTRQELGLGELRGLKTAHRPTRAGRRAARQYSRAARDSLAALEATGGTDAGLVQQYRSQVTTVRVRRPYHGTATGNATPGKPRYERAKPLDADMVAPWTMKTSVWSKLRNPRGQNVAAGVIGALRGSSRFAARSALDAAKLAADLERREVQHTEERLGLEASVALDYKKAACADFENMMVSSGAAKMLSRYTRMGALKNPESLRETFVDVNSVVYRCFRFYSMHGGSGTMYMMPLNEWSEFVEDACIITEGFRLADSDRIFIAANNSDKGRAGPLSSSHGKAFRGVSDGQGVDDGNNTRSLMRYQFMEALTRVAIARFIDTKQFTSVEEAVRHLVENLIAPHMDALAQIEPSMFALQRLYTRDVDMMLTERMDVLETLFTYYASKHVAVGLRSRSKNARMSMRSFASMLEDSGIVCDGNRCQFTMREARYAFVWSQHIQINEMDRHRMCTISFEEFLQTLGRVADAFSLPPIDEVLRIPQLINARMPTFQYVKLARRGQLREVPRRGSAGHGTVKTRPLSEKIEQFIEVLLGYLMEKHSTNDAGTLMAKLEHKRKVRHSVYE